MRPQQADAQRLDPAVVEQAMLWMVRLQSGASSEAERLACQRWRQASAAHELAWQRLDGLGQGLRNGTHGVPAARSLLQARSRVSRRALLGGLAGAGVLLASGYGVHQRSVLPTLLSDYGTATGERRSWRLATGLTVQLDTGSALDGDQVAGQQVLTLNRGRVLVETGQGAGISVRAGQARILPGVGARLVVQQQVAATLVQVLDGRVLVEDGQGVRAGLEGGWQQLFAATGAGSVTPLPVSAAAWTQGQLVAERMALGSVLADLDRYRKGVLRCDPRVAGLQVSGTFSLDQPEASLDLLAEVLPVRVQRVLGYWATVVPA